MCIDPRLCLRTGRWNVSQSDYGCKKTKNSNLLIRGVFTELLTGACCKYPTITSILGHVQVQQYNVSIMSKVELWLPEVLAHPSGCQQHWQAVCSPLLCNSNLLWPLWSNFDRHRCALFMKSCVRLSVWPCAQLHLHVRIVAPVTQADVHRKKRGISYICCTHVSPVWMLLSSHACLPSIAVIVSVCYAHSCSCSWMCNPFKCLETKLGLFEMLFLKQTPM